MIQTSIISFQDQQALGAGLTPEIDSNIRSTITLDDHIRCGFIGDITVLPSTDSLLD
jgi:hypothetical protein